MSRDSYDSLKLGGDHPDFKASSWVQHVLGRPGTEIQDKRTESFNDTVENWLFNHTLSSENAIRARVIFRAPTKEAEAVRKYETCFFMSVSWGIDGRAGLGHGGFYSLIFDHLTGSVAKTENPSADGEPPATVTMTVDYKAPMITPCILLCRAWPIEISGRKCWSKGVIEDAEGKPLATAKALFINLKAPAQPTKL